MENNIENAKAFLTKWRDERTHPVSTDYFAELIVAYASSVSEPKEIKLPSVNFEITAFDDEESGKLVGYFNQHPHIV